MSRLPIHATVSWKNGSDGFSSNRYSRVHEWSFDGGATVAASSSPDIVPVPLSDPTCVDPEEAFLASISSCHMLWFLALAAKAGYVVDRYLDQSLGEMQKNERAKLFVSRVILRPEIRWGGESEPDGQLIAQLHQRAHEECFIANSVVTDIKIEPA